MADPKHEILQLIASWRTSLEAKDVEGMMKNYSPDGVLYDACPPYKTVGADGIASVWKNCLPYIPDEYKVEHRDLQVHVAGDLAFVYGLFHFVPTPPDHPCGQTWMRVTLGLQRVNGTWTVMHEHVSIPYNPMNDTAWKITDPDQLSMPDYANQAGG